MANPSPRGLDPVEAAPWTRGDSLAALCWFAFALVARFPFVLRAEGILDHDQSVVGLMALDIARAERFPVFFDGQRYMGAVEAYIAAGFVRVFGHGATAVALAPWLVFGLFVAGQFALWRTWRGQATGHLAALLCVFCAPMLALWGVIPRGGYIESMAWALPTLAAYRALTRPGRTPPGPAGQFGCGLLFALGYFLNPLSIVLYATLAVDWVFGRHGSELRERRASNWNWLDSPSAPFVWVVLGLSWLILLTFCVHVDPRAVDGGTPYVAFGGLIGGTLGQALGVAGVFALLGFAGWWSGAISLISRTLVPKPWEVLGIITAVLPFLVHGLLVKTGTTPAVPSLPVWLGAPWNCWPNVLSGVDAFGPLIGSDPRAVETVLIGQGIDPPESRRPILAAGLLGLSTAPVALVLFLLGRVAWRSRADWLRFVALRGNQPGDPVRLCLLYLAAAGSLFLLQGTSPNASSVRYLIPVWVALPGLLAVGILTLPGGWKVGSAAVLIGVWAAAQVSILADIDRPAPARRLAEELERRGINAVVAQTPVAIVVANLSHGKVGALEFRPYWPRLGQRYRERFEPGGPVVCVSDRRFPWDLRGQVAWSPDQDFERFLRILAARHPGRVKPLWSVDRFDVWGVDLPLDQIAPVNQPKPGAAGGMESDGPPRLASQR